MMLSGQRPSKPLNLTYFVQEILFTAPGDSY